MKLYPADKRQGDAFAWRVWHAGDSVEVAGRIKGGKVVYGYRFKGFWHGSFESVRDAWDAWKARPVVGTQGVLADVSEPLTLDDLDMAMF